MISPELLLIVLGGVAAYSLLSNRLEMSIISLPMLFTGLGLVLGQLGLGLVPSDTGHEAVHLIAEVTLVLVLFSDASRVSVTALKGFATIPARMLLIGMPLTFGMGTLVARWVSPQQPWPMAFLVAAILTPTDAALGQSVVSSPTVPKRIGQTINVESGLNDGLALPVVLVAAILAATASGVTGDSVPENVALYAAMQVLLGPLIGVAMGYGAARLLDLAISSRSATTVAQGLYFLATAFVTYLVAEQVGGNGFIAAFVGGLTFGNTLRAPSTFIHEFMEGEGQVLTMLTFLIFGAVLAPLGLEHATKKTVVLAFLFLTAVRMLPVWIALIGVPLTTYERLFLGWFGPRGLASILFALLVLERFPIPGLEELVACVVLTVLMSIVFHGVTAVPMSRRFS